MARFGIAKAGHLIEINQSVHNQIIPEIVKIAL